LKMSRIIVLASIWLVECYPSLRSDCMVLPSLKGFDINKDLKFIYFSLVISVYIFLLYICRSDLLHFLYKVQTYIPFPKEEKVSD